MKQKIEQFLNAWKDVNYKKMYKHSQATWKSKNGEQFIKDKFSEKIDSFEITEIVSSEKTPCLCDAFITVSSNKMSYFLSMRLIKESKPYSTDIDGIWGVNPISVKIKKTLTAMGNC